MAARRPHTAAGHIGSSTRPACSTRTPQSSSWASTTISGRKLGSGSAKFRPTQTIYSTKSDTRRPHQICADLENYRDRELSKLRISKYSSETDVERRLQVHREVVDKLLQHFQACRPVLSAAMVEYEYVISKLRAAVQQLKPMESSLATADRAHTLHTIELEEKRKRDLEVKDKEISVLKQEIASIQGDKLTETVAMQRMAQEVTQMHAKFKEEEASKRMLLTELQELKLRVSALQRKAPRSGGDFLATKNVEKLKAELDECNAQIVALQEEYADVVPRNIHEALSEKYIVMAREHEGLLERLQTVEPELEDMQKHCDELTMERNILTDRCRSRTPRPDWDQCGVLCIEGNMSSLQGKSSKDKLAIFVETTKATLADSRTRSRLLRQLTAKK